MRALEHRKEKGRRTIHGNNKIEQQQEQGSVIQPQQVFEACWNRKSGSIKKSRRIRESSGRKSCWITSQYTEIINFVFQA